MFRLTKALKSYREAGPLNEQINLLGFIDDHMFLTKSGHVGVVLSVTGVDYECLDGNPKAPGAVVFTIAGNNKLPEQTLDHWEGYRGSGPVRIGNDAVLQFQGDIYGELMDAFYLPNKYVNPTSYDAWVKIRDRLEWICENWQHPDAGIWEMRNRQEHFVYSKVMNWVALDRGLRLADKRAFPPLPQSYDSRPSRNQGCRS